MQNFIIFILTSIIVILSIALMVKMNGSLDKSEISNQNDEDDLDIEFLNESAVYRIDFYKNLLSLVALKKDIENKSREFGYENEREFIEHILKTPI